MYPQNIKSFFFLLGFLLQGTRYKQDMFDFIPISKLKNHNYFRFHQHQV